MIMMHWINLVSDANTKKLNFYFFFVAIWLQNGKHFLKKNNTV